MQARLTNVLGLHRTTPRDSTDSVASFAGSIDTQKAFKKFCKTLYQIGVTKEIISEKESEILNILKPPNIAISGQIDDSNIVDPSELLPVSSY